LEAISTLPAAPLSAGETRYSSVASVADVLVTVVPR